MKKTHTKKILLLIAFILISITAGIYIQKEETQYKSFFVQKTSLGLNENASETNHTSEPENQLVDINTNNSKELEKLNGIGEKLAMRIIEYREKNGDFEVIEDIMRVSGIGKKKFEAIKDSIYIAK